MNKFFENNLDRILGVFLALWALVCIFMVFFNFRNSSWLRWGILVAWTLLLSVWVWDGWSKRNYIEVGQRGQLLFLGGRLIYFFPEGRRFAPKPFGIKPADTRKKTQKLDPLRIFTKDIVEVEASDMSIVYEIVDQNKYNDVDPKDLDTLFDDITDKNIKAKVKRYGVKKVVTMSFGTNNIKTKHDLGAFGIKIDRIIVPTILPTDPKVLAAIQLETTEKFQREGQLTEAEGQIVLVSFFMKPDPATGFPGLNLEQAVEQAQLTIGQATKGINAINLNPLAVAALEAIVGGKK